LRRIAPLLLIACAALLAACSGPTGQEVVSRLGRVTVVELPTLVPSVTPTRPPAATPTPLPTSTPADTPAPAVTPTPSISPTPSPTPIVINDLSLDQVLLLPAGARANIDQIAARGREMGRDSHAFSRLGGSVSATPHLLGRWDTGPYDLGPFAYLQPTIDYYAGSFANVGQAAKRGLTARAAQDPFWSDEDACQANETPLECEVREHNPSVMIVFLGTNDIGLASQFEADMRALLEPIIDQGIVPVLVTKTDRFEGDDDRNNTVIRALAAVMQLPLLDFDLIAATIPGRGTGSDDVHLVIYDRYDYTDEVAFDTGYGVLNLTVLMMLDAVRLEIAP
jgi:hypothetical protein